MFVMKSIRPKLMPIIMNVIPVIRRSLLNIDKKSSLPLVDFIVIPIVYPCTITIKNMVKK